MASWHAVNLVAGPSRFPLSLCQFRRPGARHLKWVSLAKNSKDSSSTGCQWPWLPEPLNAFPHCQSEWQALLAQPRLPGPATRSLRRSKFNGSSSAPRSESEPDSDSEPSSGALELGPRPASEPVLTGTDRTVQVVQVCCSDHDCQPQQPAARPTQPPFQNVKLGVKRKAAISNNFF